MRKFDETAIIQMIAAKAQEYQTLAESFAKSRLLLASVEYGQNEEESSALEKIANGIKCKVVATETGVGLDIDFDDNDPGNYLEIIQHGMPAPVTGGAGGFVHNPDGSIETSKVPPTMWGELIPEFAKTGTDVLGEVREMLSQLFADEVRNIVQGSHQEIAEIAKAYVIQEINAALSK